MNPEGARRACVRRKWGAMEEDGALLEAVARGSKVAFQSYYERQARAAALREALS